MADKTHVHNFNRQPGLQVPFNESNARILDCFKLFATSGFYQMISDQTNLYAEQHFHSNPDDKSSSYWDSTFFSVIFSDRDFSKTPYSTAQKMKFSIKDFFSICERIRRKLRIWSHLLRKSLMENFIFCAVLIHSSIIWKFHYWHCLNNYLSWVFRVINKVKNQRILETFIRTLTYQIIFYIFIPRKHLIFYNVSHQVDLSVWL